MNKVHDTRRLEATATKEVRCLTRRVWDAGRAWRDTVVYLVWFWRLAVIIAMVAGFVYAWNAPEFRERAIATAVIFALGIVLGLDLITAMFNLPLLGFYALLWCAMSVTSLLDVFFFGRHLSAKTNHIAVLVMFANFPIAVVAVVLWAMLRESS
jgi:hypothetical protein